MSENTKFKELKFNRFNYQIFQPLVIIDKSNEDRIFFLGGKEPKSVSDSIGEQETLHELIFEKSEGGRVTHVRIR